MNDILTPTRVLITVMTYPHPSKHYQELVCTAGITEDRQWVRLYPIDYRYRPSEQRFHKYQWIKVDLAPTGSGNDARKESRRPELDSIKVLGPQLPALHAWAERRAIVDAMPHHSRNELRSLYKQDKTSLGIVRPSEVLDVTIEKAKEQWKPGQEAALRQFNLFKDPPKALRKLPYKFSYVFRCEDSATPHHAMIEDWELGVLYLKEEARLGNEEAAAQSVRHKYLNEICSPSRDTRFFMGTVFPHNTWVVIGVFWPPKQYQPGLF